MEEVCYTREGALEKAIGMEAKSFGVYRKAYLDSKNGATRTVLERERIPLLLSR